MDSTYSEAYAQRLGAHAAMHAPAPPHQSWLWYLPIWFISFVVPRLACSALVGRLSLYFEMQGYYGRLADAQVGAMGRFARRLLGLIQDFQRKSWNHRNNIFTLNPILVFHSLFLAWCALAWAWRGLLIVARCAAPGRRARASQTALRASTVRCADAFAPVRRHPLVDVPVRVASGLARVAVSVVRRLLSLVGVLWRRYPDLCIISSVALIGMMMFIQLFEAPGAQSGYGYRIRRNDIHRVVQLPPEALSTWWLTTESSAPAMVTVTMTETETETMTATTTATDVLTSVVQQNTALTTETETETETETTTMTAIDVLTSLVQHNTTLTATEMVTSLVHFNATLTPGAAAGASLGAPLHHPLPKLRRKHMGSQWVGWCSHCRQVHCCERAA